MAREGHRTRNVFPFLLLLLAGCQTAGPAPPPAPLWKTMPASLQVPVTVQRLVVLYPKTYARELISAYNRLEGAAFQLKEQRPSLKILDRYNLQAILGEQRFQFAGAVSDESAIRLGRLLGADSVLLYHVEIPTLRDQVFARFQTDMPPVMVASKVIMVESAEVVFHNVVTTPVEGFREDPSFFITESHPQPFIRAALDRGIAQTIVDLHYAFR